MRPPTSRSPPALLATLLHALFDLPRLRLMPSVPRDIAALLDAGVPIRGLT